MKNDTDFSGKRVLVVGGSSGIGNGIAHGFRERGAQVHVWGTRARAADYDFADGSDLSGLGYDCVDVGDPAAIEAAPAPFEGLDVLIFCQGTVVYRRGEFEREGWDRVMAVNLDSLMHCARKFRVALSDSRGSIVIVSSVSGLKANIGNPAYAASKAGAISLTKTLGQAFAADGIRVNGLAPDGVELPDDPRFQNLPSDIFISVSYPINNPDPATIWGVEAAVERRLDFLPGVLSGLGVYANYTYTHSKKTETQTWSTSPIYDNGVLVGREAINYSYRTSFNQSPEHSGTAGLTYSSKAIDASLYYTMQARRKVANQAFNLDIYDEAVSSLDFRADYRFNLAGADLKLSVEGLNLLKGPSDASIERSVGGVAGTPKYYTSGRYFGGRSFAIGLSATF